MTTTLTPAEMLDQAQAHFEVHQYEAGGHLVWTACEQTVLAALSRHDIPCPKPDDIWDAVSELDKVNPSPEVRYTTTLLMASVYRQQGIDRAQSDENQPLEHWELEHHEFLKYLKGPQNMVKALAQPEPAPALT